MRFPRSSGLLLHPTSLPGPYGIGDFGDEAYRFVDFLVASGQKLWGSIHFAEQKKQEIELMFSKMGLTSPASENPKPGLTRSDIFSN